MPVRFPLNNTVYPHAEEMAGDGERLGLLA